MQGLIFGMLMLRNDVFIRRRVILGLMFHGIETGKSCMSLE